MSIDPNVQATTALQTRSLEINATDADKLMAFYRDRIGLSLLDSDNGRAPFTLGTADGFALLTIYATDKKADRSHAGLYHLALRLPTRKDLAAILMHLVQTGTRMTVASDHGYSNALYLYDPEGNGIEIYWDKPESEWDILENGVIVGITERLDLEELVSHLNADDVFDGLPIGSDLGHMHLHVFDLQKSWDFYRNILGLGLKYVYGDQAIFTATGNYHHHLGMNTWRGTNLTEIEDGEQGLRSYTWLGNSDDLETVKANLVQHDVDYTITDDGQLYFKDNTGYNVYVKAE